MSKAIIAPLTLPVKHKKWLEDKAKKEGETMATVLRRLIANSYARSKRGE